MKKLSTEEVISRCKKVHGETYDYSHTIYKNKRTKINVTCKIHGEFLISTSAHISQGQGCRKCGIEKRAKSQSKDRNIIIAEFNKTHNHKYDYSKMIYKNVRTPIEIICKKHGSFFQSPENHRGGHQCPNCSIKGFDKSLYKNKKIILYYVKVNNLYKIGISSNFKHRFNRDIRHGVEIKIIKTWKYEKGEQALEKEKEILTKFNQYKYIGEKVLFYGNTELFTKDILNLENNLV